MGPWPSKKHLGTKTKRTGSLGKSSLPRNGVHKLHLLCQEEALSRKWEVKTSFPHSDGADGWCARWEFVAQNYFRRLPPKQFLWVMVEVVVIHTCKVQIAGFLASKPNMTHTHLYHLPGACPTTLGQGWLPIPTANHCFLATRDSGFIASKWEMNC